MAGNGRVFNTVPGYGRPDIITIICGNRSRPGWNSKHRPSFLYSRAFILNLDILIFNFEHYGKKYTYFDWTPFQKLRKPLLCFIDFISICYWVFTIHLTVKLVNILLYVLVILFRYNVFFCVFLHGDVGNFRGNGDSIKTFQNESVQLSDFVVRLTFETEYFYLKNM